MFQITALEIYTGQVVSADDHHDIEGQADDELNTANDDENVPGHDIMMDLGDKPKLL